MSKIASSSSLHFHYGDVIMATMPSQITSLTIVYSTVYSGADQRKYQSSASLAFVWGIHPAQMASNAENVSIWWRHHAPRYYRMNVCRHMDTLLAVSMIGIQIGFSIDKVRRNRNVILMKLYLLLTRKFVISTGFLSPSGFIAPQWVNTLKPGQNGQHL